MIKRFDLVKIKTVKNVRWVSGPASRAARPDGVWSVVGGSFGGQITIVKEGTVVMVPEEDLYKIADYDVSNVLEKVKAVKPGEETPDGDQEEKGSEGQGREERTEEQVGPEEVKPE